MPKSKKPTSPSLIFPLACIAAGLALPACGPVPDSYTPVFDACNYRPDENAATTLTPQCRTALEAVIPYDRASFAHAPAGLLDQVTEAFQAFIGYPLAEPSTNAIFGVTDALSGAIPLDHWRIFQEDPNPNKAIFNYVLGQVDEIRYEAPTAANAKFAAEWIPQASNHARAIVIYDGFGGGPRFTRAATLAHEARHGDGIVHIMCTGADRCGGQSYDGVLECDAGLTGAHGMEITYYEFLLHGSAVKRSNGRTGLRRDDVATIGKEMMDNLTYFIHSDFPALTALMSTESCSAIDYAWVMEREGLPELAPNDPAQAAGSFRW